MRSQTWCTDVQLPANRFAYWRDEIFHHFSIDLSCRDRQLKERKSFFGQLKTHELGPLLFTNSIVSACEISRSERAVALDKKTCYQLTLIHSGHVKASQRNLTWELSAGELILLDYNAPYTLSMPMQGQLFSVLIPGADLERRTGKLRDLLVEPAAHKLDAKSLAAEFLKILPPQLDRANPHIESRIAEHVTDIVATTLLSSAERVRGRRSTGLSSVLQRAFQLIEAELGNDALSPGMLASALGISIRYLNLAFASQGLTVMRYVRDRRLDRCITLLRNPLNAHRRISEIAYAAGFGDLSFFNRSFRSRFGITPRQARQS